MFKSKSKKVNNAMLKEGLLAEGGGLTAANLAQLNGINDSRDEDVASKKSGKSDVTYIEGLKEFNKYGDLFQDLTHRVYVETDFDVVNIIISQDSKHTVAIVCENDEHFQIQCYSLTTFELKFKHEV